MNFAATGHLFLRLYFGIVLLCAHGLGKLPPSEGLIQGVTSMGLPAPIVLAWAAALAESLGALFIALGLFTRVSSAFVAITMAVAAFVAHAADPFQRKELALIYLVVAIYFALTGGGSYSLDAKLGKAKTKR